MEETMKRPSFPFLQQHAPVLDRFMQHAPGILVLVGLLFGVALGVAGWLVVHAPEDYQHGLTGKILYIHVPSAWLATLCYAFMTLCALRVIFKTDPVAVLNLDVSVPLGCVFTFLTLATGSLWGRPAWGAWWVWDARLTSVLVLFLLYVSFIIVRHLCHPFEKAARMVAILTLFGCVNIPIVKFSVQWWQTVHQPTSLWATGGSAIEAPMLSALLAAAVAFLLLFVLLQLLGLRSALLRAQLDEIQRVRQIAKSVKGKPSAIRIGAPTATKKPILSLLS